MVSTRRTSFFPETPTPKKSRRQPKGTATQDNETSTSLQEPQPARPQPSSGTMASSNTSIPQTAITIVTPTIVDWFTYNGQAITSVEGKDDKEKMGLKATISILEKLLRCPVDQVSLFLVEQQKVQRLWFPKLDYQQKPIPVKCDTHMTAIALSMYLFAGRYSNSVPCSQCTHSQSKGPAALCVQTDRKYELGLRMSCTNCWYSGSGSKCSHRLDWVAKQRKKQVLLKPDFVGPDDMNVEATELGELYRIKGVIEEALKQCRGEGRSPTKRRRI